jgi:hypothetical protein
MIALGLALHAPLEEIPPNGRDGICCAARLRLYYCYYSFNFIIGLTGVTASAARQDSACIIVIIVLTLSLV